MIQGRSFDLEEISLFRKHEEEEKSGHDRMELLFGAFVVSF